MEKDHNKFIERVFEIYSDTLSLDSFKMSVYKDDTMSISAFKKAAIVIKIDHFVKNLPENHNQNALILSEINHKVFLEYTNVQEYKGLKIYRDPNMPD